MRIIGKKLVRNYLFGKTFDNYQQNQFNFIYFLNLNIKIKLACQLK